MRERFRGMVEAAQDRICAALEAESGARFAETRWERPGGGGGRSRLVEGGSVLEKAGVNTSAVWGELPEAAARAMREKREVGGGPLRFYATGVSLVIHPRNPFAPTAHANYRYFELEGGPWWFGGGADLTPSYLFEEDARHFHAAHKSACDRHDPAFYPRFKAWCDRYFRIEHRGECRGVGGIFYDDLADRDAEALLALAADLADAFVQAYVPILARRKGTPSTEAHRRWQLLRRGRYVEFNLVYDRGTTFGLKTGARAQSVLMSLPLEARWEVDDEPAEGSEEARLLGVLREPRDWV